MTGFLISSRSSLAAICQRVIVPDLRRFLPECLAAATAIPLATVVAYWLQWSWLRAVLAGLVVSGLALAISRLVLRAARDSRDAETASIRILRFYELTQQTLDMDLLVEPGPRLASLVHQIFALDAVAIFDADLQQVYTAGRWSLDPLETVQNVYHFGTSDDDRASGISRRVVRLGSVPIGSLVLRGDTSPLMNSAIAALIAITFDRYRALANETRIEEERRTEQLRATVLDSLAHDYKTPLTAIRAASSGLAEMGSLSPEQSDLVALIDEQAALLAALTNRLLTTARLEAGEREGAAALTLQMAPEPVESLVEDAVASLGDRAVGIRIKIDLPKEPLVLGCDRRLIGMLLAQYLDNACKYAEFDSTVTVMAAASADEVVLSVHSFGPMIPMADRERIFDRYYRSSSSSGHIPGTGIGLSIAKRAALAHGGSVWVSSDEAEGTTFFAALPARVLVRATESVSTPGSVSIFGTHDLSDARSIAIPHQSPAFERSSS